MIPYITPMLFAAAAAPAISTPTLFATNLNEASGVSSQTVTWPASVAANDIGHLFVHVTHPSALPTITDPAGWTLIESLLSPDGLTATKHYWMRLTGSESGTFTVSLSGTTLTGVMHADLSIWRGCKTSGNPYEGAQHTFGAAARTDHYAHDITTAGPNRRVMAIFGVSRTNTTESSHSAGWNKDWEQNTASGLGANAGGYSIEQLTAGYVGPLAVTVGSASIWTSVMLAWVPAGDTNTYSAPAIAVRGSRLTYVNNASSLTFTLPSGSTAGDLLLIQAGHGFSVSTPSGWTNINTGSGSNANGAVFMRILSAGDISTGTISISFGGTYYGAVSGISFVGPTSGIRDNIEQRDSAGASTRNISTTSAPQSNDYAAYFGFGRFNGTVTCNLGSALQTTSNLEASAVLTGGILGSSGVVSPTFSFSATPTGDYVSTVVVQP